MSVALSMIALPTADASTAGGATVSSTELLNSSNDALMPVQQNKEKPNNEDVDVDNSEENGMMKPNFRLGAYTYGYGVGASKLGSLAALANYNGEKEGESAVFLRYCVGSL